MARIPLIAVEGAVAEGGAAEGADGRGAEVGQGDVAKQGAEATCDKGVEHTVTTEEDRASDAERVAVDEHAEPTADASPEVDATNAKGATHVSVEQVGEAAHRSSGGNADDEAHVAKLKAVLLTVNSPGREANADAEPVETAPFGHCC
jgi:hypothetical protein